MSDVVRLEEYRGRREQRFRRTTALYQADPDRAKLVRCLGNAVDFIGADRGAVLWVDEYGAGLVHVHTLLDLGSDEPRRGFSITPLRKAWEEGVPGLLDFPDMGKAGGVILPEAPRSFCTVALGSDGARSWFLVADSMTPRPPLSGERAESLMFLAGECASILLHSDLGEDLRTSESGSFDRVRQERFSGWPVLQDIEGVAGEEGMSRRVTCRFLVTRLVCTLVDDDFSTDSESLRHQIEGVRRELAHEALAGEPERPAWERVVDAVDAGDRRELGSALLELSDRIEWQGHVHGARELHRLAYDVAVATGTPDLAVDAARFVGRACRRLSEWDDAFHWYGVARAIAAEAGLREKEAMILDGLGNTVRERGNLPRALEIYGEVLEIGRDVGSREVQAKAHHNLAVVEKHAGHTDDAIRHGWAAVDTYDSERWKLAALADLGDIFLRSGQLDAAEDAFSVVAAGIPMLDYRILALDALAHVAALRGDRTAFERRTARVTAEGAWEDVSPAARAQVLLFRGKSYRALGDEDRAAESLREALRMAEEHEVNRVLFEAETLLEGAGANAPATDAGGGPIDLPEPTPETVDAVRGPLTRMREAAIP